MLRAAIIVVLILPLLTACEEDKSTGGGPIEMVTISGIVRDVDTGDPAEGVKVRLLDTAYADKVVTGTDGAYELEVPKNSTLYLVTDDPNSSVDNFYPMINADFPPGVATTDMLDWPIHACPQTIGEAHGSLAVYDHYLKTQDDANGDMFPATGVEECATVVTPFWGCEGGSLVPDTYTFNVTSHESAFPVAYFTDCVYFNGWDTACNPTMYPPDRTVTDHLTAVAISFGDPDFTGRSVGFTMDDTLSTRNVTWVTDFELPVRRGMLTLAFGLWMDNLGNRSVAEFLNACVLP